MTSTHMALIALELFAGKQVIVSISFVIVFVKENREFDII